MNRRSFLQITAGTFASLLLGFRAVAKKASPRKFIVAVRGKVFPGTVKDMEDINDIAEWGG